MEDINLYIICFNAFVAVLALLSILALAMRVLIVLFPAARSGSDPALVAAISGAAASVMPGARVTRMEEIQGGRKS